MSLQVCNGSQFNLLATSSNERQLALIAPVRASTCILIVGRDDDDDDDDEDD